MCYRTPFTALYMMLHVYFNVIYTRLMVVMVSFREQYTLYGYRFYEQKLRIGRLPSGCEYYTLITPTKFPALDDNYIYTRAKRLHVKIDTIAPTFTPAPNIAHCGASIKLALLQHHKTAATPPQRNGSRTLAIRIAVMFYSVFAFRS